MRRRRLRILLPGVILARVVPLIVTLVWCWLAQAG
jgi:hypothetical protein